MDWLCSHSSLFLKIFKKSLCNDLSIIQSINKHLLFCYVLQSSVSDLVDKIMSEEGQQHLLSAHCKLDTVLDTFKYIIWPPSTGTVEYHTAPSLLQSLLCTAAQHVYEAMLMKSFPEKHLITPHCSYNK